MRPGRRQCAMLPAALLPRAPAATRYERQPPLGCSLSLRQWTRPSKHIRADRGRMRRSLSPASSITIAYVSHRCRRASPACRTMLPTDLWPVRPPFSLARHCSRLGGMPELTMTPGRTDLHPSVLLELSNNVPHLHGANLPMSCDNWSPPMSRRAKVQTREPVSEPAYGGHPGSSELLA
jgi:hypothetical protein